MIDRQRHRFMYGFVVRDDLEFGVIGIVIRRHDRHRVGFVRRGMLRQLHRAAGVGGADVNDHRHARLRLIERDRGRLLALFDGHGRPLAGGAEHEQTLHAGFDVKIDQLAHHLFIDANLLIERRDYRQQNSTNHVSPPHVQDALLSAANIYFFNLSILNF